MEIRNYGIDFLKFIATIMITNSHFVLLYKDHNIGFATLGAHGNALFFFVSGFFLTKIETKDGQYLRFDIWIKNKIIRLWPTMIVFFVFANLIFYQEITWYDFLFAGRYWFVRCFIVSFSIIYFLLKYFKTYSIAILFFSILITAVYIFISPKISSSVYHGFNYVCYFSSMMLGVTVKLNSEKIKNKNFLIDLILCITFFILYFVIMFFGKGKNDNWYYIQLLAIFPLLFFVFYSYKVVCYDWCNKLAKLKIWSVVFVISSLTFEIYIVQFNIITDFFNFYYPFNTVIVFLIITVSAYILRILTNFFLQLFSKKDWCLRNILLVK